MEVESVLSENMHFYKPGPDRSRALQSRCFRFSPAAPGGARKVAWFGQGPCPGPASSSSPSGWPAARASLFRAPHTEVTFSDTPASTVAWSVGFRGLLTEAAAVAASAARSVGRRHGPGPGFARLVSIRRPRLRLVSWSVVSAARACCGLLRRPQRVRAVFSAACCVVSLGVSFLKRSLRARPAPAAVSFRRGRCDGPCFSALATKRGPIELEVLTGNGIS